MSSADQDPAEPDARLDALVRAAAAARRAALAGHPDPDELADYSLGALPPAEMERLAEHLALCAGCAQVVLDLTAILQAGPGAAAAASPPAELDREWERLAARLRHQEREDGAAPDAADGGRRRATPLPRSLPPAASSWALAASLLLAAGLLAWGVSQHRELVRSRQPSADVAFLDLSPLGAGERSGGQLPEAVPPAGATVVLLLNLGELRTFPSYGLELRAPDGSLAWRAAGAFRAASGQLLLEVPRQALAAAGAYRVEVSGLAGTERVRLAEYAFRVAAARPSVPGR